MYKFLCTFTVLKLKHNPEEQTFNKKVDHGHIATSHR